MRFVWKHALTNALRLWRETLPLFLVCLIAAAVLAASSLLSGYSRALYDSLSEKYTTTVRMYVSPIYSQTGEQISEQPKLTYGMVMTLAADDTVEKACFQMLINSAVSTIQLPYVWQIGFDPAKADGDLVFHGDEARELTLSPTADARYSWAADIAEGRGIDDVEGIDYGRRVVMISETLAAYKNLSVGDTLAFAYGADMSSHLFAEPFEIVGIFKDDPNYPLRSWFIYIPLSVLQKSGAASSTLQLLSHEVHFILREPDMAAEFIENALYTVEGMPLAFRADDYEYKREAYPSAAARDLNGALQVVTEVTGVLLTVIISLILIRLRRREMMILRTVTGRRLPGMAAYVTEKAIVSLAGALLGGLIGCGIALIFFTEGMLSPDPAELLPLCGSILIPPAAAILTAAVTAGINALTKAREVMSNGT